MANSDSLQNPSPEQEIEITPPPEARIISLGAEHDLAGFADYLGQASLGRLEDFDLEQLREVKDIRRQILELLERLADALAIRKAAQMRLTMERQRNRRLAAERVELAHVEIPDDEITIYDPWFRRRDESFAIVGKCGGIRRHRWPAYFTLFGCLRCGRPEGEVSYGTAGFCRKCYATVSLHLRRIDAKLASPRLGERVAQEPRWNAHFSKFGCLVCQIREGHGGCGFCKRCGELVRRRLIDVEQRIRKEREG